MASTYVPISTTTLASTASSVSFNSIPSTYTDLVAVITAKSGSSNYEDMKMQINSDTGNSYSTTTLAGYSTSSVESLRYSNQSTSILVDADANVSKTANYFQPRIIHLMNYSNSTTYKTWLVRGNNTETGVEAMVGLWRSTSAITDLTFTLTANSFSIGCTFTLYGIKAA